MQWNLGSGNKKWTKVEDPTAHGGHCLRSPSLGNNALANLYIGIKTDLSGKFSFYYKTSTEQGDVLHLKINNDEVEAWSGIGEWEYKEFELTAGNNLILFTFKKDSQGSAGEDAVMIDDLLFPPYAKMVLFAGDDEETCSNASFTPDSYIYNHSSFTWTTNGDGMFDDATSERPTYTFGESDKAVGHVELTLTGISAHDESQQSSSVAVSLIPSYDTSYTPTPRARPS